MKTPAPVSRTLALVALLLFVPALAPAQELGTTSFITGNQLTMPLPFAPFTSGAEMIPFDEAFLFLEENATDGDLGVHLKVDGEGWERVVLVTPGNQSVLDVKVKGTFGKEIGLTELFIESAEPSFEDVPREDFLALVPEGIYTFYGKTVEGPWLVGMPELTHIRPDEVELLSPAEDAEVDSNSDLVLNWETVDDPDAPDSVIEFYEVVVEKDEDDELLRTFTVIMLPEDTSLRVPSEFLEAGKDYKIEIIAQETTGNRTGIESPFSTAE